MTQNSRAEYYRRLGVEAQQRAGQTTNLSLKEAFKGLREAGLRLPTRWNGWIADITAFKVTTRTSRPPQLAALSGKDDACYG